MNVSAYLEARKKRNQQRLAKREQRSMNITQRIDKLQAELDAHSLHATKLHEQLDALKAEVTKPQETGLWVPGYDDKTYFPCFNYPDLGDWYSAGNEGNRHVVKRGLAFRTAEAAAEIGKWLAVMGKIANCAKQFNEGKAMGYAYVITNDSDEGLTISMQKQGDCDRPRFTCREDAERCLALLTDDEKATLIKGIS